MKSTIKKTTYEAIYRLLNRVSPLSYDCGSLCGAICCSCEEGAGNEEKSDYNMGIYLLPGEEKLFSQKEDWLKWNIEYAQDYDFPDSWFGKIYFIRCKTPPLCPRDKRPLQCRFFPLAPYLSADGELQLILSPAELPYTCPLIAEHVKLETRFIQASYTVWTHLIRDPLILDLVKMDSADMRFSNQKVTILR